MNFITLESSLYVTLGYRYNGYTECFYSQFRCQNDQISHWIWRFFDAFQHILIIWDTEFAIAPSSIWQYWDLFTHTYKWRSTHSKNVNLSPTVSRVYVRAHCWNIGQNIGISSQSCFIGHPTDTISVADPFPLGARRTLFTWPIASPFLSPIPFC